MEDPQFLKLENLKHTKILMPLRKSFLQKKY
jgi:hypothetical protein